MNTNESNNDLTQVILSQAIEQIKFEQGDKFDLNKINLAELERRTGITRAKLRRYKKNNFIIPPHGRTGMKAETTVLTGFSGVLDDLLKNNVSNASVCFDRLCEHGYKGSLTQVRVYIEQHKDLIPPKRLLKNPQGNRGRRYQTGPGESYQMDWGFINVEDYNGNNYRFACFAMVCHHCGECYIEFFPNAKQENLFIGMIHAFYYMGVPRYVLTDNMKSVVISRDSEGHPIWQRDYESFMKTIGFSTKLCKPRHPFTKGKVERLVRFVKDNFLPGRVFTNITELNYDALHWCNRHNSRYHRAVDCIPDEVHQKSCWNVASVLDQTEAMMYYLCPERAISFDGFVSYEGRRFGVPFWYQKRICRIQRSEYIITIYDQDMSRVLATHNVTWSRKDSFCHDQYVKEQPEEYPSMPVRSKILQIEEREADSLFSKFNFEEGLWNE
ncbi:IS21 family transposase [Streptococcus orisasini]|uniref:IS21 family transposase n=1 Tax=Streptococcus orisasini TaxID=1080071 RepID=UPI00070E5C2F|nr:IS21 family transposase [Streptococcus orisasini]